MTEKRFYVEKQIFDGYCIVDNHYDGYYAYEKQDLERLCNSLNKLNDENEQLKKKVEDLEFELRTIKAYDRTIKEEHSDSVYDFQKKIEKW